MLNFAVGPVMMDEIVLNIGNQQIPYFRTEEFSAITLECENILVGLANAPEMSRVIFLTGSGTAAMEAAVMNSLGQNDKILVVNGGSFGARFSKLCEIHGLVFEEIKLDYFEPLREDHLVPFDGKGFTAMLVNCHETSTGVLYDMELIKRFCETNRIFLIVDAISSFLADPYSMKDSGANITILSSQKALALPPGMSYIIADDKAQQRIQENAVQSLYFDLKNYLLDGQRGQTPYTPAVSIMTQLHARLKKIERRGVSGVIQDVAIIAEDFRKRIVGLPFEIASPNLSNALTPLKTLGEPNADVVVRGLKDDYGIFVLPSGGNLSKSLFRVGHIGNISIEDNIVLIDALKSINLR